MKRIIICLLCMILLTGCNNFKKKPVLIDKKLNISAETYVSYNPIVVGLYEDEFLIKNYNTKYTNMADITVFNIYYTNQEKLENNIIKSNWNKYYNTYEKIDQYKIGFDISFIAEGKTYHEQILDPDCEFIFAPYLYIYLYDDIHQKDGTWYSHITKEQVKEDTIYSSIKLFMADKGDKIESPIKLTVFTYDKNDFDYDNMYIGKSKYTVNIIGN